MLFKYVIQGLGATPVANLDHRIREDLALLLAGEVNLSKLSAVCNQALSGFVSGQTPLNANNRWTIERKYSNAGDNHVILKRAHPSVAMRTSWLIMRNRLKDDYALSAHTDQDAKFGAFTKETMSRAVDDPNPPSVVDLGRGFQDGDAFYLIVNDGGVYFCRDDFTFGTALFELVPDDQNSDLMRFDDNSKLPLTLGVYNNATPYPPFRVAGTDGSKAQRVYSIDNTDNGQATDFPNGQYSFFTWCRGISIGEQTNFDVKAHKTDGTSGMAFITPRVSWGNRSVPHSGIVKAYAMYTMAHVGKILPAAIGTRNVVVVSMWNDLIPTAGGQQQHCALAIEI